MKLLLLILFAMLSCSAKASIIPSTSDSVSQQTKTSDLIIKSSINASRETTSSRQHSSDFISTVSLTSTPKPASIAIKKANSLPYPHQRQSSKSDSQLTNDANFDEHALISSVKELLKQGNAWKQELSDSVSGIFGKPTLIEDILISADKNDAYLELYGSSEDSFTHWSKFEPPKLDFVKNSNSLDSFIAPNPLATSVFTATPQLTASHFQLQAQRGSNKAVAAPVPVTADTAKSSSILVYLFELMEKVGEFFD